LHEAASRCRWRGIGGIAVPSFGYHKIHQAGSHIVIQCDRPNHHRIAVPNHDPLRLGTLNAILRAVENAIGVARSELLSHLR
jgi:predicted RNA binding protein YcfA (HicA-like mRNA interferase family)